MRLIRPTTITPAMITACDIPETDYTDWSSGTAYIVGNMCIYGHKIYECLVNHTNTIPTTVVSPARWLDRGYNNRWKMFDQVVGSQTSQADSFTVTVEPGVIDSIAILDIEATLIEIVITDPIEGEVYSETIDMITKSMVVDWYTYFVEPIITDDSTVLLGIPPYGSAAIQVTVTNTGGSAKVGTLIFGMQQDLGLTQYDPTVEIIDYSRKSTDDFGITTVVERAYSKRLSCSMAIPNTSIDIIQKSLATLRATPIVWVGAEGYSAMIIYGFYKSFSINIPYPNDSFCSLEIEGLT